MHPARLSSTLRRILAAAALGLFAATSALAQAEPELLLPSTAAAEALARSTASVDRMVTRQRPVQFDMAPLLEKSTRAGTSFNVELFDGRRVTIDTIRVERRGADDVTYFGKVRGQPLSEAVLTYVGGHLSAEILLEPSPAGAVQYRIRSQGAAGHWLQEIDGRAFPPDHPGDAGSLPSPRLDKLQQGQAKEADLVAADTGSGVDLMVVYSNQTAAAAPGIASEIQNAVDRANLAYANTGVSFRLRLVYAGQVSYDESGNFSTELSRLSGSADGFMDNVHALRNTHGADMVSLFVEASSACGIGYIGPSAGAAFTVVNRGCAGGNLTLAHEIGHNFGARHDTYVDASTSPYAWGHGYAYPAGGWRTVMAYNNACSAAGTSCTRLAYFSNPANTYGGVAMGSIAVANNARVHNDNAYTVANFRQAVSGGCTYAFSPASANVAAGGASGSTSVTAGSGCAWNTTSSAAWLTIGAGSGTSGNGTLNYVAAANTGPARAGTLGVGGTAFAVNQATGCTYTVSPTSVNATAAGGTASVGVTTSAGCTWTASSGAAWMSITAGANGSGNGTVTYSVQSNTGALRTGNLTVAGRTVTVTQAAAASCSYALSPISANVAAGGASGSTSVTAGSGCAWNTTSSAAWLTIGAGSGTSGNGTLNWVATANTGPARSATISVGGAMFSVAQSSGCTFAVSPTSASIGAAGGTQGVNVTTVAGCSWSASSGVSWMTIGSGAPGIGSGTVTYNVSSNASALRTGSLTVAGRTVDVTQSAAIVTPPVSATLNPTGMDFGSQAVGTMSNVQGGTFANTGTVAITISAIALGGNHPGDFVARNACFAGLTLQPGASCAIGYAFAPRSNGNRSATATVTSEAGNRSIALSGNGKNARAKP